MRRKGHVFKRAPHLGYRYADPTRDFDDTGRPIDSNYVIIVSLKDCEINTETNTYNAKNAPALFPHRYSRTNMVYGVRRVRNWNHGPWKGTPHTITLPVYWVENGRVYQSTIKHAEGYPSQEQIDKLNADKIMASTWRERMNANGS